MRSVSRLSVSLVLLAFACDGAAPAPTGGPTPNVAATPQKPDETASRAAEAQQRYESALALEAAGRYPEARSEVELALAAGAGRDAKLLAAKMAILRDDLDAALRLLEPLAATQPDDALVLYNLGLIAQRRNEYNNARSRYLAAIKADPSYAPARYNLALLTWEAGVKDEAQHHALKFLELSPTDPLAVELRSTILAPTPPADPAATTATSPGATNPGDTKRGPPAPRKPTPAPVEPAR